MIAIIFLNFFGRFPFFMYLCTVKKQLTAMTDDEQKRQKGSISPIAETQRCMALAAASDNTDTDDTDVF
jgi:hypothetical protein